MIKSITFEVQKAVAKAVNQTDWRNEIKYDITFDLEYGENEKIVVDENEVMNLAA